MGKKFNDVKPEELKMKFFKILNRYLLVFEFTFLLSVLIAYLLSSQGFGSGNSVIMVFASTLSLVYFYVGLSMMDKPGFGPIDRMIGRILYWSLSALVVAFLFTVLGFQRGDVILRVGTIGLGTSFIGLIYRTLTKPDGRLQKNLIIPRSAIFLAVSLAYILIA